MQFSYKWIKEYFEEDLPEIKELAELLTFHAFEIEGVEEDLIDIDVLPNRTSDCLCYQGIAKEISVLTGLNLKEWNDEPAVEKGLKSSDFISLKVENTNLVPRATKRLIQNVKVEASPKWLKEKLESIGQKSINNIVDITNYIMWETGQPVHAFDFDKIAGNGIKDFIIRNAENGEKITTLDSQEFELNENVIVIADKEKALDIAGTKGGIVSGIDENTKNVVLSVCNFNQTNIRKTSRKLGLRTDASVRFENEISPDKVEEAMERLTQLVVEITGGKASGDVLDEYPKKANLYKVGISTQEVNRLLGLNFSDDDIMKIFNRFGFEFEKVKPIDKVLELAPTFEGKPYKYGASVSYDAPNKFDCSSFTAYLFAQAGIGIPRVSVDQYFWGKEISESDLKAGDLVFAKNGEFSEEKSYIRISDGKEITQKVLHTKSQSGLVMEGGVDHVGLYLGEGKVIFASGEDYEGKVVTQNLKESKYFKNLVGYRRISDNSERFVVTIPHERLDLRIKEDLIEELGRVYGYKNIESKEVSISKDFKSKINKTFYYINKIRNILVKVGFDEVYTYTFGDKGKVEVAKPLASNLGFLRTNLSDGIQKSLELNTKNAPVLGLDEIKIFEIGKVFNSLDDENLSLAIGVKSIQEVLEILNSELGIKLEGEYQNGVWEINLDEVIEKLPEPESYEDVLKLESDETIIFKKISQYPFILRDIAVWVSNENTSDDLLEIIKKNAGELLVQSKLFDTYTPAGENKTSYAFNLVFQSQDKTLTDEEINEIMNKIAIQIESKGWEVR